jgi:hypothetical protein
VAGRSTRSLDLNENVAYGKKIVLNCRSQSRAGLDDLVESFIRDGVKFVGVVGVDASHVEDIIDEIVVGNGSDTDRFILTSSHENGSLQDALEFARGLTGAYAGEVQVVEV